MTDSRSRNSFFGTGSKSRFHNGSGAGQFVLRHKFNDFNRSRLSLEDRYYHGAYDCRLAMLQPAGEYWAQFYPGLARTLAEKLDPDGSWPRKANQDGVPGFTYSTSLVILPITPTYQLLPIYQQ